MTFMILSIIYCNALKYLANIYVNMVLTGTIYTCTGKAYGVFIGNVYGYSYSYLMCWRMSAICGTQVPE